MYCKKRARARARKMIDLKSGTGTFLTPDIISIAPMLDYTDRHFRYLMRLITRNARLYTEMYTINEILEGNTEQMLGMHPAESPVTLQLGGSQPDLLAKCCQLGEKAGFDEINLNLGCPSSRVQRGGIGACLMLQPELVSECLIAMRQSTHIPITVKCRLGVDHVDSYSYLHQFIQKIVESGCQKVIVHARKAWLSGLSPRQNREIPPLNYDMVYQLKRDFPGLYIVINGGISSLDQTIEHLEIVEGVMIGRAAYSNPFLIARIESHLNPDEKQLMEEEVINQYIEYMVGQLQQGVRLNMMARHLLGLFHGKPGANAWRRHISSNITKKNAGPEVVQEALAFVSARSE